MPNKGWECPKCGKCYSPFTMKCDTCGAPEVTQDTLGSCQHVWNITSKEDDRYCMRCGMQKVVPEQSHTFSDAKGCSICGYVGNESHACGGYNG